MFEKIKEMLAMAIFKRPKCESGPPFGCPTCGTTQIKYLGCGAIGKLKARFKKEE